MNDFDSHDDITSNPRIAAGARTISDVIDLRLSRRGFIGGLLATSALVAAGCSPRTGEPEAEGQGPAFTFEEIIRGTDETHHAPAGYRADVLLRWGDPLFADAPAFDPEHQTARAQRKQFGYNNDFLGFVPLDPAEDGAARGLLCVNHEYTNTGLMFPDVAASYPASITAAHCATEMAAHGGSIVEIRQGADGWAPVVPSQYNRRITADTTPMRLTGPAAGHPRLQTVFDPQGRTVTGTINNCAGGITPWGTFLMAEENFNNYFLGELPAGHRETGNYERYGVPGARYQWGRFNSRYDLAREPNEPNRYGWVVEVDPMGPASMPRKHTALGRFKHEGSETVLAPDGRVVVYMGDDQRFDYVYKFVSARAYDPADRQANMTLLEEGTLYVARFDEDGTVTWLPLVFGEGPLNGINGFYSQADVLIETRRAADLLEATPMDRPEDVEPDPQGGRAWLMLTNNNRRTVDQINAANPRADNAFGHIIEIIEPGGDFASTTSTWEFLVKCGDPANPAFGAMWNPLTTENGWFGSPDNCAVDPSGRLWVATDGNPGTGAADGIWAMETEGSRRGTGRAFFRAPAGAEVCGPCFTPDGNTLFLAVQHPGDTDDATYEAPGTRWPDFEDGAPPRPSVVAVSREDGGPVGS